MSIVFPCFNCANQIKVPDGSAGQKTKCPICGHIVTVPHGSVPPANDPGWFSGTHPNPGSAQGGPPPPPKKIPRTMMEQGAIPPPLPGGAGGPGPSRPAPRRQPEDGPAQAGLILTRLTLGLAVFISLLAGLLAVLRVGGDILAPVVGGLALMFALVALGLGLSGRKSRPYLGSAATAVFLGLGTLLFTIGANLASLA